LKICIVFCQEIISISQTLLYYRLNIWLYIIFISIFNLVIKVNMLFWGCELILKVFVELVIIILTYQNTCPLRRYIVFVRVWIQKLFSIVCVLWIFEILFLLKFLKSKINISGGTYIYLFQPWIYQFLRFFFKFIYQFQVLLYHLINFCVFIIIYLWFIIIITFVYFFHW
jgi:hypothetical protein